MLDLKLKLYEQMAQRRNSRAGVKRVRIERGIGAVEERMAMMTSAQSEQLQALRSEELAHMVYDRRVSLRAGQIAKVTIAFVVKAALRRRSSQRS
jgi:hypothetical protein